MTKPDEQPDTPATPPAPTTPAPNIGTVDGLERRVQELTEQVTTLTQERDAARADLETTQARTTELEGQMDAQKNAEQDNRIAELEAENQRLKAEQAAAARRTELDGKVSNVDLALKALDPEKHLRPDGTVNVDALVADYSTLAPASPQPEPSAPDGAGGVQGGDNPNLEKAVATGDAAAINAAFDAELNGKK